MAKLLFILPEGCKLSNSTYRMEIVDSESKKPPCLVVSLMASAPREIRTPVLTLKGLRPGPLDDGGLSG
jgi:hypothetical protein